jgi:uncharacterized protein YciI
MRITATRAILIVAAMVCASAAVPAQAPPPRAATPAPPAGMTQYFMVFLRRGPAWTAAATPEATKVSQGHMANIERLTKEGIMVVAGPFEGQTGERALAGIFILRVRSMEEATRVTESDPAVKAGRFVYEIAPWWGPTSLRY